MVNIDQPRRDLTLKYVKNPSKQDFKTTVYDDNNAPHEYNIPSGKTKMFKGYIANIIIDHLMKAIKNERLDQLLPPLSDEDIKKQIEVNPLKNSV